MKNTSLTYFVPQYPQLSDDQLLSQAKSGDQQAFSELCLRYKKMLKQRIFRIVRHPEDTEDVLQDTFLNAYRHLHAFRETCKFSTWLIKIANNVSLMLLRKRKRLSEVVSDETAKDGRSFVAWEFRDHGPDPEQNYITGQTVLTLRKAIQTLPPGARSVMDLYYRQQRHLKEAAAMLGITEAAAKSRMSRARQMLFRSMKKQWNPEGLAGNASRNYQETSG
jgi:RNA polymerase sigma-70 factor (ECF subfamily)